MVRHMTSDDGRIAISLMSIIRRLVHSVCAAPSQQFHPAQVFRRRFGIIEHSQRRRIRRDDTLRRLTAQSETVQTECAVLIVQLHIKSRKARLRDSPRALLHLALRALCTDRRTHRAAEE